MRRHQRWRTGHRGRPLVRKNHAVVEFERGGVTRQSEPVRRVSVPEAINTTWRTPALIVSMTRPADAQSSIQRKPSSRERGERVVEEPARALAFSSRCPLHRSWPPRRSPGRHHGALATRPVPSTSAGEESY